MLLDPPFAAGLAEPALASAGALLRPSGFVYLESARALEPPPGLAMHREARAGAVHYALLRPAAGADYTAPHAAHGNPQ